MNLFSGPGMEFFLRWWHFLAGITWIGMLYYFNFVQTPFFGSKFVADNPPVRSGIVRGGLLNSALWWFRWGAMITFITGWLMIFYKFGHGGGVFGYLATSQGLSIIIGGLLGSTMWANVWFVIWPNQQVVMRSAEQVATGGQAIPDAAARGAKAGVTSRTNTMLSIPMLWFMGAGGPHLPWSGSIIRSTKLSMLVLTLIVIVLAEINALSAGSGPGKKMLSTLKGTFWAGFILTAIFWICSVMTVGK